MPPQHSLPLHMGNAQTVWLPHVAACCCREVLKMSHACQSPQTWTGSSTNSNRTYLPGYPDTGANAYDDLSTAMNACKENPMCGGITLDYDGKYTLRKGPDLRDAGVDIVTWLRVCGIPNQHSACLNQRSVLGTTITEKPSPPPPPLPPLP